MPAQPHPRESFDMLGGEAAELAFLGALQRGRLAHAWLIAGPEGAGKATLAYRIARRLLGATPEAALGPLGAAPAHPVSRQIAARAHPDLLVLQRDPEDGKTRRDIPVDEARRLPEFFAKSPAAAPWRVAIVDTADDLNRQGENALLKILEEPPERGILLLLSKAPGALLPTVRSRCRRLRLVLPEGEAASVWLQAKAGLDASEAERLLTLAGGSPGRAWRLAGAAAAEMDEAARAILARLPGSDAQAMARLGESFRGAAGQARFDLLFERLAERIRDRALADARAGAPGSELERSADAWRAIGLLRREAEGINLDRADALHAVLSHLRGLSPPPC